jgi:hypothetical protein
MNNLDLVPIQNSLGVDVKKAEIKKSIMLRLGDLNLNLPNYRNSNEFLLLILNLIEHLIVKKDKISKKELALEIINDIFNLTEIERNNVDSNIEFLWSNKNIKKVSFWKLFKCGVKELFFAKKKE